tara:strand:+ start:3061 stop:3267 length:207 start_codon:yes stop_codon:yes gene_type:complete
MSKETDKYLLFRIETMEREIGALRISRMIYALQLYNLGFLPEQDPLYDECKEIAEVSNSTQTEGDPKK